MLADVAVAAPTGIAATDTANIRTAINQTSQSGDKILFQAGTYVINDEIHLIGNRIYQGNALGTIIDRVDIFQDEHGDFAFRLPSTNKDNITIDGITFEGRGITLGNNAASGLVIQNCIFRNQVDDHGGANAMIYGSEGLTDSTITNNYFTNIDGNASIYSVGAGWTDVDITGNTFREVKHGVHLTGSGASALNISNNTFRGIRQMGIELQGSGNDFHVNNNTLSRFYEHSGDTFAISVSIDSGLTDLEIKNNEISDVQIFNGLAELIHAIEIKGTDAGTSNIIVDNNQIHGAWGAVLKHNTTATFTNNRVSNWDPYRAANPGNVGFSNGGSSTGNILSLRYDNGARMVGGDLVIGGTKRSGHHRCPARPEHTG